MPRKGTSPADYPWLNCALCSRPFQAHPGRIERGTAKYCSCACNGRANGIKRHEAALANSILVSFTCPVCSRIFERRPDHVKQTKGAPTCSPACKKANTKRRDPAYAELHPEQWQCMHCGTTFKVKDYKTHKYCSRACQGLALSGAQHPMWRGGRTMDKQGYVVVWNGSEGRIHEHRLIMEQALGRLLTRHEHVHHRNENKSDNRLENLEVLTDAEHASHHWAERLHGRWSLLHEACLGCGETARPHASRGYCSRCLQRKQRGDFNFHAPPPHAAPARGDLVQRTFLDALPDPEGQSPHRHATA